MAINKTTIINQALTLIGAGSMFSVDDGSELSEQIEATWPMAVDHIFGMHDWSFSKKTFKNRRLVNRPENGWAYAFELPGNRLGPPLCNLESAGSNPRTLRNFALEEGLLFANVPDTWSQCKVLVDPDYWDPPFRSAFIVALGGYLAVPVWQDADLQDQKFTQAFGTPSREGTGGMFGRLMAQDKTAAPIGTDFMASDPLTAVHHAGGRGSLPWHGEF
ncbi:hypothetical protein DXT96_07355 [Agrobacterium sp. ICMP 6402]|uniref:hypothetical protein n=1 Tax=Agrobacterium sp. ICMP 6402 TaxID=2292443 RepID=UPI001296D377|nr:hypothetical protein [Agrobacterium sp. ICMP 6402]MQB09670.1 hypothetical protein [Agrobacterium sp. ICMP 6402]